MGGPSPRIAISLILRSKFDDCVAWFACRCGSFVPANKGTSKRDFLCSMGDEQIPSVRKSNKMMSRTSVERGIVATEES